MAPATGSNPAEQSADDKAQESIRTADLPRKAVRLAHKDACSRVVGSTSRPGRRVDAPNQRPPPPACGAPPAGVAPVGAPPGVIPYEGAPCMPEAPPGLGDACVAYAGPPFLAASPLFVACCAFIWARSP